MVERSDELEVVGLAAQTSGRRSSSRPKASASTGSRSPTRTRRRAPRRRGPTGTVLAGAEGLVELITERAATSCSTRSSARPGSGPTIASLGEGIDLALANKESLVVGGELVMALAEATGAQVIPVDSEHSALYPADRRARRPGTVDRLVLTASGGPFRGRSADELRTVTREDALAHPTWDMGGKITIDSATLMNKGLELIEAHHLFGVPYDRIDVVVHPQSIIHALVHLNDGASLAHLGLPRHARADLLRAAPPGAGRRAGAAARPGRARPADVRGAGPRRVPVPAPRARGRGGRGHRAVRAERGERGGGARVPRGRAAVHRHRPR